MDQNIREFLEGNRFAIVGVSRSATKFGNAIYTELKQRGYTVFAVHPVMEQINGDPCYPCLETLPEVVDGVVVCVAPQRAGQVVNAAAKAGIKKIWLQQGAQSIEALAQAQAYGMTVVNGRCILMYAEPVSSMHGWHRSFARIFGMY